MESKDLIKINEDDFNDWQVAIDVLYDAIKKSKEDIPEKVIKAAELYIAGFPTYEIATKLGVKTNTVRGWLVKYPQMSAAIAKAKEEVSRWRMLQLEKQFTTALQVSEEVLTAAHFIIVDDEEGKETFVKTPLDVKLLGIQAQHARWVLDKFFGHKLNVDVKVTEDLPILKASLGALQVIADRIKEDDEPEILETTVRVIDLSEKGGPLIDSNGDPYHGVLGKLDKNKDGIQCHICGERFERLDIHIRTKEKVSTDLYETVFMLGIGDIVSLQNESRTSK